MHAWELLILQQHADHVRQAEVCAEGQLADSVAIFVCVAILPEFFFEVLARASCFHETTAANFQHQRRFLQVAILAAEVIAGSAIADEGAIYLCRRGEYFAGWKV